MMSHDPQSPTDAADFDEAEDECGAWINGRFDYYSCRFAGTDYCAFECPRGGKSE